MQRTWKFAKREDGTSEGWEPAELKNFKGNPLRNLARELIQNSLDAPRADSSKPIKVNFELCTQASDTVPDVEILRDVISRCLDSKDFYQDSKESEIKKALTTIEKAKIDVLKISEEGTLGMAGPCEVGKPFYKYMKGKSQSSKDANSLGSHGQGKAAPILCSHLHTIFASTVYKDELQNIEQSLVMGRATLSSHLDEEGDIKNNVGFWGNDFNPVPFEDLPNWLKRDGLGTNIYIVGFKTVKNWEKILIASVVQNFFPAITKGTLTVRIGDTEISEANVGDLFSQKRIRKAIEGMHDVSEESFEATKGLFEAYTGADYEESSEVTHIGHVKIFMKRRPDTQKRNVGLIRDGMFITNHLDGLKRFPKALDGFDVLIEPQSRQGSQFIKAMEPPAHDGVSPTWLPDEDRAGGRTALKKLTKRVKELLDRHFMQVTSKENQIAVFDEWFTMEEDDGAESSDIDPAAGFRFARREPTKRKQQSSIRKSLGFEEELIGDEGGRSVGGIGETDDPKEDGGSGGNGGTEGPNYGVGTGGRGQQTKEIEEKLKKVRSQPVTLDNVRAVPLGGKRWRVSFKCDESCVANIWLSEFGADLQRLLQVTEANAGEVTDDGMVQIKLNANQRTTLELTVNQDTRRAIGVFGTTQGSN